MSDPEVGADDTGLRARGTRIAAISLRARRWSQLLAVTGAAQGGLQAIAFACGILIIRLLPTEEYAYYTISTTVLGAMTILANCGIIPGVMAEGGKVWSEKTKLGRVLATGLRMRYRFATLSAMLILPMLYYLLDQQGAPWYASAAICFAILPAFIAALSGALFEIGPKLHQKIGQLQRIRLKSSVVRLLTTLAFLIGSPFAAAALLATGAAQLYENRKLRALSEQYAAPNSTTDPTAELAIGKVVRRAMPESVYLAFSGQISVWLISIFGDITAIAEVGALGRLGQIFVIFTSLVTLVAVPRFAVQKSNKVGLLSFFIQLQLALLALWAGLFICAWLFANPILSILGEAYTSLQTPLLLIVTARGLMLISNATQQMGVVRGIIAPPAAFIGISLVAQVLGILAVDVSTLTGVLTLTVVHSAAQAILYVSYVSRAIWQLPN